MAEPYLDLSGDSGICDASYAALREVRPSSTANGDAVKRAFATTHRTSSRVARLAEHGPSEHLERIDIAHEVPGRRCAVVTHNQER